MMGRRLCDLFLEFDSQREDNRVSVLVVIDIPRVDHEVSGSIHEVEDGAGGIVVFCLDIGYIGIEATEAIA